MKKIGLIFMVTMFFQQAQSQVIDSVYTSSEVLSFRYDKLAEATCFDQFNYYELDSGRIQIKRFNQDNKLLMEFALEKGKRVGEWKYYAANGTISDTVAYLNELNYAEKVIPGFRFALTIHFELEERLKHNANVEVTRNGKRIRVYKDQHLLTLKLTPNSYYELRFFKEDHSSKTFVVDTRTPFMKKYEYEFKITLMKETADSKKTEKAAPVAVLSYIPDTQELELNKLEPQDEDKKEACKHGYHYYNVK